MPDPHGRRGLPERWLLPPAPREADIARRWGALPFERRRALAATGVGELAELDHGDAEVVAGLARARLATAWRPLLAALVLGWFVLMSVWGFGRATYPTDAAAWLAAGLALGLATWVFATYAALRRVRRARALLAASARRAR